MLAPFPLYLLIDGFIGSIVLVPFRPLRLFLVLADAVGRDGEDSAFAALSRWRHGGRGLVASVGHGGQSEWRGCHGRHKT